MDAKKNRRPVANDQSGNPMSSAHCKGSKSSAEHKTQYSLRDFFNTIAELAAFAAATMWPPADKRKQFAWMFYFPTEHRCVLTPDASDVFERVRTNGYPSIPISREHPVTEVCFYLEYHRVKRIYMVGTGASKAFREYCNGKGVEVCLA